MSTVTPEDVSRLTRPTDGFLCPLSANSYGLDFLNFTITDYESKKTIFEIGRDNPTPADVSVDFGAVGEDMYRKIKYTFSEDVLKLPYIQTSLVFSVGHREVRDFRMIERHYFRDQLIKSFDFKFGFCIPGSVNTWDAVYSLPPLSDELIADMTNHPYDTKSDSFYFVDGKIVMHNKASYKYILEDAAQSKKSYEDKFVSKGVAKASKPGSKVLAGSKAETYLDDDFEGLNLADAKEASSSTSPRGAAAKTASKDIAWSKETDYY